MTVSLKHLNRLCAGILLLATALSAGWVGIRIAGQWRQIRSENAMLEKHSLDLNRAETDLQQFTAVLDAARREFAALNERIPSTAEMGKFIKQLQERISAREIQLLNLTPLPVVEKRRYHKRSIKLTLKGSYTGIFKLLNDLETMRRMVLVERLIISKAADDPLCRAEITAAVFERPEAAGNPLRKII